MCSIFVGIRFSGDRILVSCLGFGGLCSGGGGVGLVGGVIGIIMWVFGIGVGIAVICLF